MPHDQTDTTEPQTARETASAPDAADMDTAGMDTADMAARAQEASNLLKALAHEGRLMILCHLAAGERSVTELETLLRSRQAAVSQQLARLRMEGLVAARREGKAIYYSLSDARAARLVSTLYEMFCAPEA